MSNNKHKHMTLDDRVEIANGLNQNLMIKQIAVQLHKDPTTIAKEIKKHRVFEAPNPMYTDYNRCALKRQCSVYNLCQKDCNKKCSTCPKCNSLCALFKQEHCLKLSKSPHVCNGCRTRRCSLGKYYYRPQQAYRNYRNLLQECRSGISISESELTALDELVSPLIQKNSQSLAHIYSTHEHEIPIRMRTFYYYIDQRILTARNIDLPRKVRYKPRKVKKTPKDTTIRKGRTYTDFIQYLEDHPGTPVVEIDSVIGTKGTSVLLTLLFRECHLMIAFKREANTAESVIQIFDEFEKILGYKVFCELFPIILTDNGSEFSNPEAIETNAIGQPRTRVFFCDPRAAQQKGKLENNHTLIRRLIPQGTSFDRYSQEDIQLMINHINSYYRAELRNKTPYQIASLLIGAETLKKLGCIPVAADEVCLNPSLFKK